MENLMGYETLRQLALEVLKEICERTSKAQNPSSHINDIVFAIKRVAMERGMLGQEYKNPTAIIPFEFKIYDIVWELILQGILLPGTNAQNPNLPNFHVTEYGRECLKSELILPHDRENYLERLDKEIPDLDSIAKKYIAESLQTFLVNCPMASTVMLGVSSERIMYVLIESFAEAIQDPNIKQKFHEDFEKLRFIKQKYDRFKSEFNKIKKELPDELINDSDNWLDRIFDLIRYYRNDIGHPTGTEIPRALAFANLQLFSLYVKKVYGLIEYFKNNKAKMED